MPVIHLLVLSILSVETRHIRKIDPSPTLCKDIFCFHERRYTASYPPNQLQISGKGGYNGTVGMLHAVGYESDQPAMFVGDGIRRKRGRPSRRNADDSAGTASAPRRSSQRSSALSSSASSTPSRRTTAENVTPITSPESDSNAPSHASNAPSPARTASSPANTTSVTASVLRSGPATFVSNLNRSGGGSTVQVAPGGSLINQIASRAQEFQARRGSGSDSDLASVASN